MGTLVMDNNSVTHGSSLPSTSGLSQVSNVTVTRVDSPQLHYQTTENVTYTRWVTVTVCTDITYNRQHNQSLTVTYSFRK